MLLTRRLALEKAKCVIVEVNENMPRCLGGFEEGIHISKVDMIVEGNNPAIDELGGGGAATEVDQAVARLIVDQIPDGAARNRGMPNARIFDRRIRFKRPWCSYRNVC